jgi:hypothetical protein
MKKLLLMTAALLALATPANAGQYDHLSGKDRDTLIGAAAWALYYQRCGGRVSLAQWQSQVLYEFDSEVAGLSRIMKQKGVTCAQIKAMYPHVQEAARPVLAAEERRKQFAQKEVEPKYDFSPREDKTKRYDLRPDPNPKPWSFPIYNVNGAALLAEYIATCGAKPTKEASRDALRMAEDLGFNVWLEVLSWIHLVRDADQEKQFCIDAHKLLWPAIATQRSDIERPIPEDLKVINELSRRIYPQYKCRRYPSMFATLNASICGERDPRS